jgi:hypothetical protein
MEETMERTTLAEAFFWTNRPPHIWRFKFQNDVLPPLLRTFQQSLKADFEKKSG